MSLGLDKSKWTRTTFGRVVQNVNETVRDAASAGIERVVAMEHIDPGELSVARWGSTDDETTFTRRVRPSQTLFGKRRAYQRKVAYADFDAICSGDILTFKPADGVMLPEFLPFLVRSDGFFDHALGTSAGSLSPRTNWGDLSNYEFDLPPLDEQKRIADLLWAVEFHKRAGAATETSLRLARAAIRDSLFASMNAQVFPFESTCLIPSQNGAAMKKSERAGDVPMVNMGEMFRDEVISTHTHYERVVGPPRGLSLEAGDLLFARRSIVFEGAGTCCLVPELPEAFTFESSIIRSRVDSTKVLPEFALHYFRSQRGREAMSKIVRRGPVSGVSGADLRKLQIPVPKRTQQQAVIDGIHATATPAATLAPHISAIQTLQNSLSIEIFGDGR